MNEIILIILGCLVMGFFLWREDKKTFNKNDLEVFKALGLIIKWKAGKV